MTAQSGTRTFLALELVEARRSRWILFTSAVYTLVFAAFVWFGIRESSVLGFTGLSRVVLNVSNAVVLAIPLVALVATCQAIVKPRQNGFFELMLSQPVRRSEWLVGALAARLAVVIAPLLLLFLLALVASSMTGKGGAIGPTIARCLAVTLSLAWSFIGIGFWISSVSKSAERATVLALLVWLTASALHDFALIGALLQFRLPPQLVFALAVANPVETARIAVLSSVDPDLSVLGPVGFWLANSLGPRWTLMLGVLWPTVVGSVGIAAAIRRLGKSDLID